MFLTQTGMQRKDFQNCNLRGAIFRDAVLKGADFSNADVENALFDGCDLEGSIWNGANMRTASFRGCNLKQAQIKGANLFGAILEDANLEDIQWDESTQWYRLYCPEEGAFLGYKKCVNDRLVSLYIPTEARRSSATMNSCRCDKAKVIRIESLDESEQFEEAWSLVDENFCYRKGEWVEVEIFNEDRWRSSTAGIHFWLTKEEAKSY